MSHPLKNVVTTRALTIPAGIRPPSRHSPPASAFSLQKSIDHSRGSLAHMRKTPPLLASTVDVVVPDPNKSNLKSFLCLGLFAQSVHENVVHNPAGRYQVPKVASAVIAVSTLMFLKPHGWRRSEMALTPHKVVQGKEVERIFLSPLIHQDLLHLAINMRSLLDTTTHLEEFTAPRDLLIDFFSLMVVSQTSYVGLAWAQHKILRSPGLFFSQGPIGFTSITFSLQVLSSYFRDDSQDRQDILPPQYSCWTNLILLQLFYPGEFQFQFCGIAAGLLRVFLPGPFLRIRRKIGRFIDRFTKEGAGRQVDETVHEERDEVVLSQKRRKGDLIWHGLGALLAIAIHGIGSVRRKSM